MNTRVISYSILFFQLWVMSVLFAPFFAWGLYDSTALYSPPQALGMGDAITADAFGYLANFYNPAGLARGLKRKREIVLIDLDTIASTNMVSRWMESQSSGNFQIARKMQNKPGEYSFNQFSFVPAYTVRGFGFSLLASNFYAGVSDGTNIEINAGQDVAPIVGTATSIAGNLIKVGFSARAHIRNQISGTFAHELLDSSDAINALSKQGVGIGLNVGAIISLPFKYLATLGIAWTDVLNTRFIPCHILNTLSSEAPEPIAQSINTALSIHPVIWRKFKATISVEMKHWESSHLPWQKRFHAGLQLDDDKAFYLWMGLNHLFWTAGLGYRVDGGNLEVGSYGADIGSGSELVLDRRFFLRYTIGFL